MRHFYTAVCSTLICLTLPAFAQPLHEGIVVTPEGAEINGDLSSDKIYTCERNNVIRRIEINYETQALLPCTVNYYKHDEAPSDPKTLWTATETAGFCQNKADELVGKLINWGWICKNH